MRLSKVKMAGFKSFVDPTTISFPSDLVGVVGPNGCGKSNIIDAVRWVRGESSRHRTGAAQLRHHRAGYDLAPDRGSPRRTAYLPRRSGGHLEVQGTPSRDRTAHPSRARKRQPAQ